MRPALVSLHTLALIPKWRSLLYSYPQPSRCERLAEFDAWMRWAVSHRRESVNIARVNQIREGREPRPSLTTIANELIRCECIAAECIKSKRNQLPWASCRCARKAGPIYEGPAHAYRLSSNKLGIVRGEEGHGLGDVLRRRRRHELYADGRVKSQARGAHDEPVAPSSEVAVTNESFRLVTLTSGTDSLWRAVNSPTYFFLVSPFGRPLSLPSSESMRLWGGEKSGNVGSRGT